MTPEPFHLSRDATEVLSILLAAWTIAVVVWALWASAPRRWRK